MQTEKMLDNIFRIYYRGTRIFTKKHVSNANLSINLLIYNQQNDFFAKIKTKRPKSDKIAKRNGCQKLKHTSIKKHKERNQNWLRSLLFKKQEKY